MGDVLLSVKGVSTPTIEALPQAGGQVEGIFLNAQSGQQETITLYPQNGAIGIGGLPVSVSG